MRALRRTAERLPAALTDHLYLELPPAGGEGVDLVVRLSGEGRAALAGTHPTLRLGELEAEPPWAALRVLCARWARSGSVVARAAETAWIEFDVRDGEGAAARPGVFVHLREGARPEPLLAPLLRGFASTLPAAGARRAAAAADRLPPGATLRYVGLFSARPPAVRACVEGGVDALLQWAALRGAPRQARTLRRAAAALGVGGRPILLHLDLAGEADGRLGLEVALDRRAQLGGRIAERPLLDALATLGVVAPDVRPALDRWPGWDRAALPHRLWTSVLVRRVNHVKLVARADGAVQAKAYLSLAEHFVRTRPRTDDGGSR